MSEVFRVAPQLAPSPPRALSPDIVADASAHGRFLRLFGAIWALVGLPLLILSGVAAAVGAASGGFGMPWWTTAPGGLFAFAGALLWGLGKRQQARALRVFRDGHEASGEVVEVFLDRRVRMNRRHPWRVVYAFTTPSGAARGSATSWGERPRLAEGDRVTVLYAPGDPAESVLWTRFEPSSSQARFAEARDGAEAIGDEEAEARDARSRAAR